MNNFFNLMWLWKILGIITIVGGYYVCVDLFGMSKFNSNLLILILILLIFSSLIWGIVLISEFKNIFLAWAIFFVVQSVFVFLLIYLFKNNLIPFPPAGYTFYDISIDAIFGGAAIGCSYVIARKVAV